MHLKVRIRQGKPFIKIWTTGRGWRNYTHLQVEPGTKVLVEPTGVVDAARGTTQFKILNPEVKILVDPPGEQATLGGHYYGVVNNTILILTEDVEKEVIA